MDVFRTIMNITKVGRLGLMSVILLTFISLAWASTGAGGIGLALNDLCTTIVGFLGVAMLLLIVLAAVIYAVGQMLGAETRARATVWATAMFTGAIIAAVIYMVTPYLIGFIISGSASGTGCSSINVTP